jgi:glycogen debranching enzyme
VNTLVDGVTYLIEDERSDAGGLYHGDTRHLLPVDAAVADDELTLVSDDRESPGSRIRRYANYGATVNEISPSVTGKHATVVVTRRQRVREGRYVETFELVNNQPRERTVDVTLSFGADFADIFEVRALREALSRDVTTDVGDRTVTYAYEYTDEADEPVALETTVDFHAEPASLDTGRARFTPTLGPQERHTVTVEVRPGGEESTVRATPVPGSAGDGAGADEEFPEGTHGRPEVRLDPFAVDGPLATGSPAYDRTFARARADLRALTTRTDHGPVPMAGAPWFATVFGRDALLTSYLLVPVAPALAEGTLRYLAAHQGRRRDDARDERRGKILHEMRRGELARQGTIPQTPYYGSIDATPLWATLLDETWRWTGDDALVRDLWPNLRDVLGQLTRAVEEVGDNPFLYYRTLGSGGVVHKEWRDSANGVQYADGRRAEPPLASAAVQGYLYDALRRSADLADAVVEGAELPTDAGERLDEGEPVDDAHAPPGGAAESADDAALPAVADGLAAALRDRADALAAAFDDAYWMPDEGFYAAALTADERRVDSITSTAGHCLWSGIVPDGRAERVAERLLAPDLSSGWGLRTLSASDDGYSPVSYHAGGVWPHDNAIAALGLAGYDRHEAAAAVAVDQLDAFAQLAQPSVPELFCGFDDSSPPVPYSSACRPQAWAAAAPYGHLRALFDLGPERVADPPTPRSDAVAPEAVDPIANYWRTSE